jgi:phenylacetate-CoA ligase
MNKIEFLLNLSYRLFLNDNRFKYYKTLLNNLKLTRVEIINSQNENIQKLIIHAYNSTVYYKELFDSNKLNPYDIKTNNDLLLIPPLTKEIIANNIEKLKSNDKYGIKLTKVTSGGSTGVQAVIYKSHFFEEVSRGAWLRNNAMIGWMPGDKSVWIWGSPIEHIAQKKSIKVKLGIFLNRRIILNAYKYSTSDFPQWYKTILKFKPKVVFGYSSIILEFAQFLISNNLLLPTVKLVVSTTEKLNNREIIEKAFQCNVHDQYGCREIITIAIESRKDEMLLTDDIVLLNTNESNEILLTALHSFGFPLINYRVGDTGNIVGKPHSANEFPFPVFNLKIGRITDNFINHQNIKVSSSAFSTYLSTLNLNIKEHQFIQNDYKSFTVNFIITNSTNIDSYKYEVQKCLEEYFGENLSIKFQNVDRIQSEKSGKRLMFKRLFLLNE